MKGRERRAPGVTVFGCGRTLLTYTRCVGKGGERDVRVLDDSKELGEMIQQRNEHFSEVRVLSTPKTMRITRLPGFDTCAVVPLAGRRADGGA